MHLRFEHNCTNSIDLIDDDTGEIIGMIHGPNEGDGDVTATELETARVICLGANIYINGG